ncbi:NADPH-dependent FMN reductase [Paenibacillus sp. HJGM_3]|uniref:NADPH-dependent FMN reductase n=1 Tax=Paenibacillus sp. HJGM_3 TaxID=3379816 RepID=UPI00385EFC13
MRIVGLNGSLSSTSNTYKGVKAVLDHAAEHGAETVLFDLRDTPLPLFHPERRDQLADENVYRFISLMDEADGIVLGSPEYHNMMGGAFKNALEWVGGRQFKNKPVALISATGGPSSMTTLSAMQSMVRSLHGWVVPVFGSIPGTTEFKPNGEFRDPAMQLRFMTIGAELIELSKLLKQRRQDWEQR